MMNFEKIFAIFSLLVQTISFVTVYKKICDIKKLNISIIFLYLTISFSSLILAQFYNLLPEYGDVLSTFLHYLLIFFQPLILHLYFSKKGLYKGYVSIFLSLLIYLSVSSSETFFSVIISSVTGDDFVNQYWGSYYTIVNILALFFVLKSFEFFEFEFSYFKNFDFEKEIMNVIKIYVTIETTGSPYKLRVVGKNFFKEFYGTIAEIQEQDKELGYFFSPHKSYLSNISNISGYDKKTKDVLYYDGHRSPISRLRVRYLKEILKAKSKKEENKK